MLQAGNYQPGGIWFGPLPAPTPTLCLGRAERLLVPVSISEFAVGGGHLQSLACPVQPEAGPPMPTLLCLPPHAYSLEGLGAALPLPLCSLELGEGVCLASIFP